SARRAARREIPAAAAGCVTAEQSALARASAPARRVEAQVKPAAPREPVVRAAAASPTCAPRPATPALRARAEERARREAVEPAARPASRAVVELVGPAPRATSTV